jgi:Sec-independent protein secretion pathway component TatC
LSLLCWLRRVAPTLRLTRRRYIFACLLTHAMLVNRWDTMIHTVIDLPMTNRMRNQ